MAPWREGGVAAARLALTWTACALLRAAVGVRAGLLVAAYFAAPTLRSMLRRPPAVVLVTALATLLAWRAVFVLVPEHWVYVLAHSYAWAFVTSRIVCGPESTVGSSNGSMLAILGGLILSYWDQSMMPADQPGDLLHRLLAVHTVALPLVIIGSGLAQYSKMAVKTVGQHSESAPASPAAPAAAAVGPSLPVRSALDAAGTDAVEQPEVPASDTDSTASNDQLDTHDPAGDPVASPGGQSSPRTHKYERELRKARAQEHTAHSKALSLESENQRLKTRVQSLKTLSERQERELAQLRDQLTSDLAAAQSLADKTAAALQAETLAREAAEQAQRTAEASFRALKAETQTIKAQLETLQKSMTALQHERSTSTVTVQQLQQEVTRLSEANKTLQLTLKDETRVKLDLMLELGKAHRELSALTGVDRN